MQNLVLLLQDEIDYYIYKKKLWGVGDWTLKALKEYLTELNLDQEPLEDKETHKKGRNRSISSSKNNSRRPPPSSRLQEKKPGRYTILARPDRSDGGYDSKGDGDISAIVLQCRVTCSEIST